MKTDNKRQSLNFQAPKSLKQGISLITTLLIISSILTATLIVSETTIRQSQVVYGAEVSEKGYFAAKTALEKASYQAIKNHTDISAYSLSGSFSDGSEYTASISADTDCPNPGTQCSAGAINSSNYWTITLEAGESFNLDLDINGVDYPSSLTITQSGAQPTDLVFYQCETSGSPRECSSTKTQTLYVSLPHILFFTDYSTHYYWIRINNNGTTQESYTLIPSADHNLPIGINITATGSHQDYKRELNQNIPKWQRYGI